MTAFIIRELGGYEKQYVVRDAQCLGRNCLRLGIRVIKKHPLMFSEKELENGCCTTMVDRNCPTNYKDRFSIALRTKNIHAGLGIRLI